MTDFQKFFLNVRIYGHTSKYLQLKLRCNYECNACCDLMVVLDDSLYILDEEKR